jgi:hypothetical protein
VSIWWSRSACFAFGQLLQDVGESLVVECVDDLVATLGGQLADGVGHGDGPLPLELLQQVRNALARQRQRRRGEARNVLPSDDVDGGAAAQPPVRTDGHPGHHPVAGADLFDGQVDDDYVDARQLFEFGIVDPHPGVEHLAEDQDLAGPLREPA